MFMERKLYIRQYLCCQLHEKAAIEGQLPPRQMNSQHRWHKHQLASYYFSFSFLLFCNLNATACCIYSNIANLLRLPSVPAACQHSAPTISVEISIIAPPPNPLNIAHQATPVTVAHLHRCFFPLFFTTCTLFLLNQIYYIYTHTHCHFISFHFFI